MTGTVREVYNNPVKHWASQVAQLVKNPPANRETWVQSLDGKISWRREWLPTPVSWPGEFQDCIVHGVAESNTTEQLSLFTLLKS